jgi:hypothetical protein
MTNEIEDLKRDSARLTWLIEEAMSNRHHLMADVHRDDMRQYIDLLMAQAKPAETNADAERGRWCEEMKAKVERRSGFWACFYIGVGGRFFYFADPDRDTAIDKARGVVK